MSSLLRWIGAGAIAAGFLMLRGGPAKAGHLTSKYDGIYARRCPRIPVEYLRALAQRESSSNPREADGAAWGLLQVIEHVRIAYNNRFGTSFDRDDLLRPDVSALVACELLTMIADVYSRHYKRAFPGGFDWGNLRHVEILTFGWNAGWSQSRGVGRVLQELERQGLSSRAITLDKVVEVAQTMGSTVSKFVTRTDKRDWSKSVVRLYARELRATGGVG